MISQLSLGENALYILYFYIFLYFCVVFSPPTKIHGCAPARARHVMLFRDPTNKKPKTFGKMTTSEEAAFLQRPRLR